MAKYIKLFEDHSQYETFIGGGGETQLVRPNVSHCITQKDVHYNPIQYFYVRSNMKKSSTTTKIKYTEGMKVNLMDYLYTSGSYINPYCGYTLIENTNISDNAVPNPTITDFSGIFTDSPYSFTPQPDNTYVVIQQTITTAGILFPEYFAGYSGTAKILKSYYLRFFVPKYVKDVGAIVNGVEYTYSSEDASTKIKIANSIKGPSSVIQRVNSYVAYIDILDRLKSGETISDFLPFMITPDNVRVYARTIGKVTVSEEADLANLSQNDVSYNFSMNPNYPNFITPPSEGNAEE